MTRRRALILSDGKAGHENQSKKLVEFLGYQENDYDVLVLKRKRFGKVLSFVNPISITSESQVLKTTIENNPDYEIVVGAGTVPRLILLWIKKKYPHLKTICLMDPKRKYGKYDVVAIPTHDKIKYKGDNVIRYTGALSSLSKKDLADARLKFKDEFSSFRKPLIGVLIGGKAKGYEFGPKKAKALVSKILSVGNAVQGSIYATTSRRTGGQQADYIYSTLTKKGFSVYKGEGVNPYRGILAYSDILIVTPETVSMLTEAVASGAKVLIFDKDGVKGKRVKRFVSELLDRGLICEIDSFLEGGACQKIERKNDDFMIEQVEKVIAFIKEKI